MGRHSCCVKQKLRKGLWSPEEDEKLYNYITRYGVGCWSSVPKLAGLERCGKSCRLRWINYLRPDLKRGMFSQEEEDLIMSLHEALGNRWAQIAAQLPGRTDNEIKNFWNSSLKKKLMKQGIDPSTHKPITEMEVRDEKDMQMLHTQMLPNSSTSIRILDQQANYHLNNILCTDGANSSKQVYDPLFLSEFQASIDPSTFLTHCQIERNHTNPTCGINTMPSLANFDQRPLIDAHYSDSLNAKSHNGIQINNLVENSSALSWDAENKLDSMFQFQFSGIQIEEKKPTPWHDQTSEDYSNFPAGASVSQDWTGANLDVFQHI